MPVNPVLRSTPSSEIQTWTFDEGPSPRKSSMKMPNMLTNAVHCVYMSKTMIIFKLHAFFKSSLYSIIACHEVCNKHTIFLGDSQHKTPAIGPFWMMPMVEISLAWFDLPFLGFDYIII